MALRSLALVILFASMAAWAADEQPGCEARLLPVAPQPDWMQIAANMSGKVAGLRRGEVMLIHDPEVTPGFRVQWDSMFRSLGLRVLGMRPVAGFTRSLFLVQKVERARGVEMRLGQMTGVTSPGKFSVRFFKNRATGEVKEMIGLFEPGVFVFPHFVNEGKMFVMLRPEEPGIPIVDPFDEISGANYLPLPMSLALVGRDDPVKRAMSLMRAVVPDYLGYRVPRRTAFFLAAPDGVLGGVKSVFVALKRPLGREVAGWWPWEVRPLLSRIQETAAGDGVLELNLQILLRNEKQPPPSWYGERPEVANHEGPKPPAAGYALKIEPAKSWRERIWFARNVSTQWKFVSADFQELNGAGGETAVHHGEYAVSAGGSANLISFLPVKRVNGKIFAGLTQIDSPAAQVRGETSKVWTLPIYRVYSGERSLAQAVNDSAGKFEHEFEAKVKTVQTLGASFRTDPEVSSDLIHPFVIEIAGKDADRRFAWYPLESLTSRYPFLRDARLMISLFRLEEALQEN